MPIITGTLSAIQESKCQAPVPRSADSSPNMVSTANNIGYFQICKKTEFIGSHFCYAAATSSAIDSMRAICAFIDLRLTNHR